MSKQVSPPPAAPATSRYDLGISDQIYSRASRAAARQNRPMFLQVTAYGWRILADHNIPWQDAVKVQPDGSMVRVARLAAEGGK